MLYPWVFGFLFSRREDITTSTPYIFSLPMDHKIAAEEGYMDRIPPSKIPVDPGTIQESHQLVCTLPEE